MPHTRTSPPASTKARSLPQKWSPPEFAPRQQPLARANVWLVGFYLVGGLNPSEKYSSIGMIIPNIWENKKCSKPPTSYGGPNGI